MLYQIRRPAGLITGVVSAPYAGPGDVVGSATAWWGLRAYNLAMAGTKAVNLRASGDNATADFNTLANGNLDVGSISIFLTAHGGSLFITKLYDQTGGGNDLVQATAANQYPFLLSGFGTLPVIDTRTPQFGSEETSGSISLSQPYTMSFVLNKHGTGGVRIAHSVTNLVQVREDQPGAGEDALFAGTAFTPFVTFTLDTWYACQCVFNSPNCDFYINGTPSTGDAGSAALGGAFAFLSSVGGTNIFVGRATEFGIWPIAFSAGQKTSMESNQRSYWGF